MTFVVRPEVLQATRGTLLQMQPDPANLPPLLAYLDGRGERAELRSVLRQLARNRRPASYLEVGCRRGWSLVQVAAECPCCDIVVVDPWITDYAGAPNPGADFVRGELARACPHYRGRLTFFNDYSSRVLPELAARNMTFDLVTIDGDHRAPVARMDLLAGLELLRPGGCLVFDDLVDRADDAIASPAGASLLAVWRQVQAEFPDLFFEDVPGLVPVGVAQRAPAQRAPAERAL